MRENNIDQGPSSWPDPASRQQAGRNERASKDFARVTPVRIVVGVLVLALLVISVAGSFMAVRNSYASTNQASLANDSTCSSTPTAVPSTGPGITPTVASGSNPTPTPTKKPTPKPTPTNTPTPTPTPVTPTPTPTPTDTPTLTPAAGPINTGAVQMLSYTVACTPTAIPTDSTGATATPAANPTSAPATTGGNTGGTTPGQSGGGLPMRVVLIAGGVLLVLLLSTGIGWFVFRRMMLPQAATNLPPSGARPWSRTRVPSPDSMGGAAGAGMAPDQAGMAQVPNFVAPNMGFGPGPVNFEQISNAVMAQNYGSGSGADMQGFHPANYGSGADMQGFQPANSGFNTPEPAGFGPQGMNGYGTPAAGFGGFSDSFIPPSPQIFPQSDASMIPPGSGAFPVANQGFAPASSAFNAMYGLPDDPFSSPQGGAPGWMDNLGSGSGWQGNGFAGPQQSPATGFAPGEPDMNDPYLAEVIRQYSQKGQAVRPPQPPQTPQPEPRRGGPNSNWLQ